MPADGRSHLGDEQPRWLADLQQRQFDLMLSIATRALPPPNRANAEDVVRTVFAEAVAATLQRPRLRIGEGWLMKQLRSRIADHYRHAGHEQRLPAAAVTVEAAPSPDDILAERSAVDELLAGVPDPGD